MEKRRTNPAFLSDEEARRERRRTGEMVRRIVGNSQTSSDVRRKQVTSFVRRNQITRAGETNYFIVDFNGQDRQLVIYRKEIPKTYPFKLGFSLSETVAIIRLLEQAKAIMGNKQVTRIGEKNSFVVDYDGTQRLVMVYRNETPECQFKLTFDESETMKVISLLKKAKNFFYSESSIRVSEAKI